MTQEIPQDAVLTMGIGDDIEFYIGIRHRLDNTGRMGRILHLEENYRVFFVDMIQEIDGEYFRNFDNVETFSVETVFDARGFIKNVLMNMMDAELYNIFTFISLPHFGEGNAQEIYERCVLEPERIILTSCKDHGGDAPPKYNIPPPVGFWGVNSWPPISYYRFLTDFFPDPRERERVSLWTQHTTNFMMKAAYTHQFIASGFASYNYLNNVRPEQTELLHYRWKMGGFDVTIEEFRVMRKPIYNRFQHWYKKGKVITGGVSVFSFIADEKTVRGFTGIGKVETRRNFERDEHILISLLGPRVPYGGGLYGYGEIWVATEEEKQQILFDINNPDGILAPDDRGDGLFHVLYAEGFEAMSNEAIQSEATYNLIKRFGPNAIESIYSIINNFGKIGGQTIYDNGTGTEHRYFMPFRAFLEDMNWSLDDFMDEYNVYFVDRQRELEESIMYIGEPVRVQDYSEFYDKERRAPFDGIYHYVPIPLVPENGTVTVMKKKNTVTQDGEDYITNVDSVIMGRGDFKLAMDKDEFVSSVSVDSLVALLSTFMKTKVKIKFKDNFPNLDKTKLRIFTSDFTYMNEREFKVS